MTKTTESYIKGEQGQERMDYVIHSDGRILYYAGEPGQERVHYMIYKDGRRVYYEANEGMKKSIILYPFPETTFQFSIVYLRK